MLANFRLNFRTNLTTATFALLALLVVREETLADGGLLAPESPWIAMEFSTLPLQSQILHESQRAFELDQPTIMITQEMGGTKPGDRFHQLAVHSTMHRNDSLAIGFECETVCPRDDAETFGTTTYICETSTHAQRLHCWFRWRLC